MNKSNSNPKKLNSLSENITNLIDSNKTITKMSSTVKELIENSIDANSKNISILIKDGGLSLIEIKDDGEGIDKENFSKLCCRFNSSKMEKYADIYNLSTFGFRGEALSILSYISHLTILSRTLSSDFGYEGTFNMGKLTNSDGNLKRLPCEKGTVIRVENMFYNNLLRKNYYDKNEETKDIINLISKYAFHFHKIEFSLCNATFTNKIFTTKLQRIDEHILAIKKNLAGKLFNQEISDNLNFFENKSNESDASIYSINLKTEIDFECFFTKPSANLDKSSLVIFVNNRLIVNTNIKKLFDQTYSKYLIKNGNYFVYLNINCPNAQIDVNVKANKSEVYFMNEEKFLMQLKFLLEKNLNEEIASKNYYVGDYSNFSNFKKREEVLFSNCDQSGKEIFYAKDKVRVDTKTVMIEKLLAKMAKNNCGKTNIQLECKNTQQEDQQKEFLLTINKEIFHPNEKNNLVTDIVKNNYFIGFDSKNYLTFAQYNTSLYILNTKFLLDEYIFYLLTKKEEGGCKTVKRSKVKSSYKISDILAFVSENFGERNLEKFSIEVIEELIREKIPILETVNIRINNQLQIEEIAYIDLFEEILDKNKPSFIKSYLCYIPMIYYSVIEAILKNNKTLKIEGNKMQQNENLNFIIEVCKILAHYNANNYIEHLCKLEDEECNRFLRDFLMNQIKTESGFFIRKNIKEESLLEKIVDTETLYTVFERC